MAAGHSVTYLALRLASSEHEGFTPMLSSGSAMTPGSSVCVVAELPPLPSAT